jgi:tRNA (guanine-N7-)-methyltransferase
MIETSQPGVDSLPRKIKDTQSYLRLWNGMKIQFHKPLEKPTPLSLADLIPSEFKDFPLEIEIGCGKGEFISERSNLFRERFFIGIDRRSDRIRLTQNKINHPRCLIVQEDARSFLQEGLPKNIEALHIYHPDPWPKSKHHKHRFFRSPDAFKWVESIRLGGTLFISTDHKNYFEEILEIIASWPQILSPAIVYKKEFYHSRPKTHFEGIFLNKREPVYKAVFARVPPSNSEFDKGSPVYFSNSPIAFINRK